MIKREKISSLAVSSIGNKNFDLSVKDFERLYSGSLSKESCSSVLGAPKRIRDLFSEIKATIGSLPQKIKQSIDGEILSLEKALALKTADFEEKVSLSAKALRIAVRSIDSGHFSQSDKFMEQLNLLISEVDRARYITDLPKLVADGIFRTQTYYSPPGTLVENRKASKQRPDLFDVIVIGGGPAGIAALGQLAREGVDALMLEAGRCVQSMSDARAKSVHTMRTNVEWSSLAGNGELSCLDSRSTMQAVMGRYPLREEVETARKYLQERFGYQFDAEFARNDDYQSPVARAEVFAYFHQLLAEAHSHENINILEQSPVSGCSQNPDGTIRVEMASGEVFNAKKIILASGFVGPAAEYGRVLEESSQLALNHPERVMILRDENSIYEKSEQIEKLIHNCASGKRECIPFINEAILGHPEIRAIIRLQPEGSRLAIIGSGETAAKAVLELLSINPGIKVDLFLKAPLEPSDPQSPAYLHSGPKLLRGLVDSKFADDSIRLRVPFGTPVTYETARRIIEYTQSGEARVFELGAHFSEKDLDLILSDSGCKLQIGIDPKSEVVRKSLQRQHDEWTKCGLDASWLSPLLSGESLISEVTGPFLVCAGYSKTAERKVKADGLNFIMDLIADNKGNVLLGADNFTAASNPNIAFAGAVATRSYGDTGFYGGALRATLAAMHFSQNTGSGAESVLADISSQVQLWRRQDAERFASLPEVFDPQAEQIFSSTPGLRKLHDKFASGFELPPVEKLLLERGLSLYQRMYKPLRESLQN